MGDNSAKTNHKNFFKESVTVKINILDGRQPCKNLDLEKILKQFLTASFFWKFSYLKFLFKHCTFCNKTEDS